MKNLTRRIIILSLFYVGAVSAYPVTWDTNSGAAASGSAACSSGIGNSCLFTRNGHKITARAFSTTNNGRSGVFEKAALTFSPGGLGVRNPDLRNEGGSPQHSLDNNGRDELIVFENKYPDYFFTGFEIGWHYRDSDISAWIGSLAADYDFTGVKFSDLAGLGFSKKNFSNVPNDTSSSLKPLAGNYLILAPQTNSNSNDYVKISQINGEVLSNVIEPETNVTQNNVSEPGILALLFAAFVSFWLSRKSSVKVVN